MTINEILENENIRSDRYGMAAISYIFKAFGDPIRSKEYWPWGDKVDLPWKESIGFENDITSAMKLLTHARERYHKETKDPIIKTKSKNTVKELKKRLMQLNANNILVNSSIKTVINTNTDAEDIKNSIED